MRRAVLVDPPDRLESHGVVHALQAAGVEVTSDPLDPDLAVTVALCPPGTSWERAAALTRPRTRRPPDVVLAGHDEGRFLVARGYAEPGDVLAWNGSTEVLVNAVRRALSEVPAAPDHRPAVLTDREQDVVALVAEGRRNQEIADLLGISYHTARTHVANVLVKLGLPHRHALAVMAQRTVVPTQRRTALVPEPPAGRAAVLADARAD